MKSCLLALSLAVSAWAQSEPSQPQPAAAGAMLAQKDAEQLATRMLQLMESTAVAVPGLVRASDPVKQSAGQTFSAMQRTPQSPALTWQFMNQIKAYLALSDSFPRPYPFPKTADQQFAELREDLQRLQQHFEASLQVQNVSIQNRDADPNELRRYIEDDSRMLPPGAMPRVVFLGDSITDLWRLNEYFTGRDFVNRGIAGQTTLQMLARFRQDVAALHPKAVVILAGTNDIASGLGLNQIQDNLSMLGDLAKFYGIKPVFASVLPVSDYHKDADPRYEMTRTRPLRTIQTLNRWIQEHCRAEGFPYVDYYSAVVDSNGQLKTDLSDDGLNPNAKGYRVMSPIVLEAIGRVTVPQPEETGNTPGKRRFRIPK